MVVFWRNLAGQHCIPPGVSERSVGSWKMPMRMRPTTAPCVIEMENADIATPQRPSAQPASPQEVPNVPPEHANVPWKAPRIHFWCQADIPDLLPADVIEQRRKRVRGQFAEQSAPVQGPREPSAGAASKLPIAKKGSKSVLAPALATQAGKEAAADNFPVSAAHATRLLECDSAFFATISNAHRPVQRIQSILDRLTATSALASEPETCVWDPNEALERCGRDTLREYISWARTVVLGYPRDDLHTVERRMRAAWGYATGAFLTDISSGDGSSLPDADALPSESDCASLEHLARCRYDINRAKLLLVSWLGGGRELATWKRLAEFSRHSLGEDKGDAVEDTTRSMASGTNANVGVGSAAGGPMEASKADDLGTPSPAILPRAGLKKVDRAPPVAGGVLNLGHDIGLNPSWSHPGTGMGTASTPHAAFEDIRVLLGGLGDGVAETSALAPSSAGHPLLQRLRAPSFFATSTGPDLSNEPAQLALSSAGTAAGSRSGIDNWQAWLDEARKLMARSLASWDALLSLRVRALEFDLTLPVSDETKEEVMALCKQLGVRIRNAVKWRARVRDALSGSLDLRPAQCKDLESLMGDYNGKQVEVRLGEADVLQGISREARAWLRAADDLQNRMFASATAALSSEYLHYEDAANEGPGGEAGRSTMQSTAAAHKPGLPGFGTKYEAFLAADSIGPPVPIIDVLAMLRQGAHLPVNLNPQKADLQAKVDRAVQLATAIVEHFPNRIGDYRSFEGNRVVQGFGLTKDVSGSAVIASRTGAGAGSAGAAGTGATNSHQQGAGADDDVDEGFSNESAGVQLNTEGSLADGSVRYVRYSSYMDGPYGSRVESILGLTRRARMPLCHLEALVRDVRDTGLLFLEGEMAKAVYAETLRWLGHASKAVMPSYRAPVNDLLDLLKDAEGIPVDLAEYVVMLRAEVERAKRWIERARQLVPKGGQRTRKVDVQKSDQMDEIRALLPPVLQGMVAVTPQEVESLQVMVEGADKWISTVRSALHRGESGSADGVSLQSLQALLGAGEDIPVAIPEYDMLHAEVAARKWVQRIKKALASTPNRTKPSADLLRDALREMDGIRAKWPLAGCGPANAEQGEEESAEQLELEIRETLAHADAWAAKLAALQLGSKAPGRSRPAVAAVRALLTEAATLPVTVVNASRSLEAALAAADRWSTAAAPFCHRLALAMRMTDLLLASMGSGAGAASTATQVELQQLQSQPLLSLSGSEDLVAQGELLAAVPEGFQDLKSGVSTAHSWIAAVARIAGEDSPREAQRAGGVAEMKASHTDLIEVVRSALVSPFDLGPDKTRMLTHYMAVRRVRGHVRALCAGLNMSLPGYDAASEQLDAMIEVLTGKPAPADIPPTAASVDVLTAFCTIEEQLASLWVQTPEGSCLRAHCTNARLLMAMQRAMDTLVRHRTTLASWLSAGVACGTRARGSTGVNSLLTKLDSLPAQVPRTDAQRKQAKDVGGTQVGFSRLDWLSCMTGDLDGDAALLCALPVGCLETCSGGPSSLPAFPHVQVEEWDRLVHALSDAVSASNSSSGGTTSDMPPASPETIPDGPSPEPPQLIADGQSENMPTAASRGKGVKRTNARDQLIAAASLPAPSRTASTSKKAATPVEAAPKGAEEKGAKRKRPLDETDSATAVSSTPHFLFDVINKVCQRAVPTEVARVTYLQQAVSARTTTLTVEGLSSTTAQLGALVMACLKSEVEDAHAFTAWLQSCLLPGPCKLSFLTAISLAAAAALCAVTTQPLLKFSKDFTVAYAWHKALIAVLPPPTCEQAELPEFLVEESDAPSGGAGQKVLGSKYRLQEGTPARPSANYMSKLLADAGKVPFQISLMQKVQDVLDIHERWKSAAADVMKDKDYGSMQVLIDASAYVWIDVTAEVAKLKQLSTPRCICRRACDTKDMVPCMTCGELLHKDCVPAGLSAKSTSQEMQCPGCFAVESTTAQTTSMVQMLLSTKWITPVLSVQALLLSEMCRIRALHGDPTAIAQHECPVSKEQAEWLLSALRTVAPNDEAESVTSRSAQSLASQVLGAPNFTHGHAGQHVVSYLRQLAFLKVVADALRRPASVTEWQYILEAATSLPLPPGPLIDYISTTASRAHAISEEAVALVYSRRGVPVRPSLSQLQDILKQMEGCPAVDFGELRVDVETAVSDGGQLWCVCQGVSRGFMIGCDACSNWYHSTCVGITETEMSDGRSYICLACCMSSGSPYPAAAAMRAYQEGLQARHGSHDLSQVMMDYLLHSSSISAIQPGAAQPVRLLPAQQLAAALSGPGSTAAPGSHSMPVSVVRPSSSSSENTSGTPKLSQSHRSGNVLLVPPVPVLSAALPALQSSSSSSGGAKKTGAGPAAHQQGPKVESTSQPKGKKAKTG